MAAREIGLRAPSCAATVTCTPREIPLNATDAIRSAAGRTASDAVPAIPPPAVALTVPVPSARPAVTVTVAPRARSVPRLAGVRVHVTVAEAGLPNESVAAAVNVTSPRARTSRAAGATATRAAGPATTVSCCTASVVPGAAAVRVAVPARASR